MIGAFIYEDLDEGLYNAAKWSIVVMLYASIIVPSLVQLAILIKDILSYFTKKSEPEVNCQVSAKNLFFPSENKDIK